MGLLLFGTIWFWILIIVSVGLIVWFLEKALLDEYDDTGGGVKATLVIIAATTLYFFFGSKEHVIDAFNYVKDNPEQILLWFGLYLVVGVIWSVVKWFFFLHDKKIYYKERKKSGYSDSFVLPTAAQNKYRILSWMYYWPFSTIWTIINQPIKRAFKFIYAKIESTFDKISASVFSDMIKEKEEFEAKRADLKNPK